MKNVLFLRKQRGLSQRELCEATGLARITIQGIENDADTRWSSIVKLADFYGVSTDYLMGHEVKGEENSIHIDEEFTKEELALAYQFLRDLRQAYEKEENK